MGAAGSIAVQFQDGANVRHILRGLDIDTWIEQFIHEDSELTKPSSLSHVYHDVEDKTEVLAMESSKFLDPIAVGYALYGLPDVDKFPMAIRAPTTTPTSVDSSSGSMFFP